MGDRRTVLDRTILGTPRGAFSVTVKQSEDYGNGIPTVFVTAHGITENIATDRLREMHAAIGEAIAIDDAWQASHPD